MVKFDAFNDLFVFVRKTHILEFNLFFEFEPMAPHQAYL